jgi:hypothetical protein
MDRWRFDLLVILFLPAFVMFGLGAATDIALPGVYIDAINTHCLVKWLLNPHPVEIANMHMPGDVVTLKRLTRVLATCQRPQAGPLLAVASRPCRCRGLARTTEIGQLAGLFPGGVKADPVS